ncbi:pLS20_p028 family conjugation system transmembrane protein [Bacillus cereus group sp. MYBK150-2]|uniref:pLS20_p028 family conjugation system transmembrane protein n=1 Tax=Bacillus cereus group sp. MYBK150-2 TaxID=3450679 RepID=UPI003F79BBBB
MKDEEILKVLESFSDYLQVGDIVNYVLRWLGWFLIVGLSLVVDALEGVTDAILGIKGFFNSPEIQNFVDMLYPLFVVLLAISFLYIGYMFIMNKQMNRSQIIINIFVTLSVLCLLSTGMTKVDKFTDDAIAVVKSEQKGSLSDEIIKKNITDVAVIDQNGWKKKEDMNPKNNIPEKNIRQIDITEKIDEDFEFTKDKDLSDNGKKILKNKRVMDALGVASLAELKDGWFDFFPEKYYRWHWNFWNIFFTLLITGLTLLLVSIKLARLFYELAFNYLLVNIIAPADVANGQKLKAVLSNILNIFIATIMIFLSLKLYIMGTAFLHDKLNGVPYLIALAAFSMAVLDGPAVVERLFGIDIGLKSSWGMLVGGYALGKGIAGLASSKPMKGLGNMIGKGAKGAVQGTGVAAAKTASAAAMATGGMAGLISGLKNGNESENKDSLQDQMKKAGEKKANGNDVANKEKEKGNLNKEKDKKNGGTPSIQEDMKKGGNENPGVANGQESGTTSLQDEMKEAGKTNGTSAGNQTPGGVRQGASEGSQTPGTVRQGASEGGQTPGTVRQGASEGSQTPGTVRQGASEGGQTPGTVRQGASEENPTAGTVRQGASEGSQTPGGVRQGASEGNPTAGTVRQGASKGSQTPGGVRQGASEGNPTAGTVRQGASEGGQTAGTVRQGTSEGNPTPGTVRQGASEGSQTAGTVRQGASEGSQTSSPAPVEASRPVPSGGSPAPVEASRPVPSGGSPAPVETPRSVPSGGSPAPVETPRSVPSGGSPAPVETPRSVPSGGSPASAETPRSVPSGGSPAPVETPRSVPSGGSPASADNVTVTHSSPITPYESDKEVAASRSQETRTLGQYTTDKVKNTTSSVKQKVRGVQERIHNSETVQNTKRFYQMGQNTGKSWRDIVNKNKNNTDKK